MPPSRVTGSPNPSNSRSSIHIDPVPPAPAPKKEIDHFHPTHGGGGGTVSMPRREHPTTSPGLEAARQRLEALKATAPTRTDFAGYGGDIAYRQAVALHNDEVRLAQRETQYEKLKLREPHRGDYASDAQFDKAKARYESELAPYQEELGPVLLERYEQQSAAASPTAAKLIAQAQKLGVPVTVLSDEEFQRRFPGTGGVTTGEGVFVPASALEQKTGALEHELMHGILGHHEALFDTQLPLQTRIDKARALFEEMGLDPQDGERLVRVTDGWGGGGDAEHVQTYVDGVAIAREKAGVPPLTAAEKDELYAEAAKREAALDIQRGLLDGIEKASPQEQARLLDEAEKQWARTAQGRANPPSGGTVEERLKSLTAILAAAASEDRLQKFQPLEVKLPR
ncbi:MAG: hypothetical protein IPJ65_43935 [Archangiaceae bacterium]|nr:hypothetical protein [Archangiaceae bacterium]